MEKQTEFGVLSPNANGSLSLRSIAEENETICEVDEIQKVANLQVRGDAAFRKKNYSEAMKLYNEILGMDNRNLEALSSRALLNLQTKNFHAAQNDVEKVLSLKPNHPQGHYLLGLNSSRLGQFEKALGAFLQALELNSDPDYEVMLARNITSLLPHYAPVKDSLMKQIYAMDPYRQLCEVGATLFEAGKYNTCLKVLSGAQMFQTNQKGITMKVLLMSAGCHSAMKRYDSAISSYQECLNNAISAHDIHYHTKCLISIASLYITLGDMHQGILHYQQLLNLQSAIQAEDPDAPLPDFWTADFQCALHLNLAVAFKKIGDYQKAIRHAKELTELTKDDHDKNYMNNQSYLNVGILHEVLGQYPEALEAYKAHLAQCKKSGDRKGIASAYGRLGIVHMELFNSTLSLTYHEQHLSLATSIGDAKLISEAHQLRGESFMRMEYYEDAVDCFMSMFRACPRTDLHTQTLALCKTAKGYKEMRRFQYSLHYYEQAKIIASDFAYQDVQVMCELNQACILKNSTQMHELDQAEEYLVRLIPKFEEDIKRHAEEDTHCPKDLIGDLSDCYEAIQTVLAKLSKKEDCLQYAEMQRRNVLVDTMTKGKDDIRANGQKLSDIKNFSMEKIKADVTELEATVIYYSLLEKMILIWVLQPGFGITRFYNSKWNNADDSFQEHLEYLITSLLNRGDVDLRYSGENRALPLEDAKLELIRKMNNQLQSDEDSTEVTSEASSTFITFQSQAASEKPPERQLFDLLIAPIDDVLCNLDDHSPLVVIPDKNLSKCPFAFLKDWDGQAMSDRFQLTILPSLLGVEKVNEGHCRQVSIQNDLDMRRSLTRLEGMSKLISPSPDTAGVLDNKGPPEPKTKNARQTSNPRLVKSGDVRVTLSQSSQTKSMPSRESTLFSLATTKSSVTLKLDGLSPTSETPSLSDQHSAAETTSIKRLMNLHNMSTLTTRTATSTGITTSSFGVTDFAQISSPEKCVVFGNPYFAKELLLHSETWKPSRSLNQAETECKHVADILRTTATVGKEATKDCFLREACEATVLHIATYGCIQKGYLAFSPNLNNPNDEAIPEASYLVTSPEIAQLPLVAKLVVISGGWSTHDVDNENTFALPSAFLAAGAQCILMLLWPVPSATLCKFYHHFYMELRKGCLVTEAVKVASTAIMDDQRYVDMWYWAPYCVIGKDVHINIGNIQHAMLDQTLDTAETKNHNNYLRPKLAFTPIPSKEENLAKVQEVVKSLLVRGMEKDVSEEVLALINLLDAALKRHHDLSLNKKILDLPECLKEYPMAKELLRLLDFQFQKNHSDPERVHVLMPPSQDDSLLLPVMNLLESLTEILKNKTCCRTLIDVLPVTQEVISKLVDVLCITKHAREVQVKVSDAAVHPLWKNLKLRIFLTSLGYHQVGSILNCENIPSSRKLLTACLQLLVSLSVHKSSTLVYNLDVELLGYDIQQKVSSNTSLKKLPSLNPIQLPGSRIKMGTPWLTAIEEPDEMNEKMQLAKSINDLQKKYRSDLRKTKRWHKHSMAPQAADALAKIGRPDIKPSKVKISASPNGSHSTALFREETMLDLREVNKRREHADSVLRERLDEVTQKYKNMSQKLFLPYVAN